ncbi:response regulator [Leptospira gomenensis]|uniref:Response regulator n=1 Tax=Leptospira gomenensis TaxID=2484974 RepID=A0A5F1Y6R3_9LEPT|nr:response regulator [Leptospira gomenensis]TGK28204.1 response regulator [Leptospira gomenensis]TGK36942.1 response regulator [Leptospira gomenensis]TGK45579.1 response regulator [Leptospira gomenensis]TGK59518.1 response regulator [Leptospira gomenensis]
MKVLVLDSGATVRKIISSFFPAEDFRILEAGSAKTGLELAFSEHFDVITVGMILPDSDGFDVCKLIRGGLLNQRQSPCRNSKIYLITSGDIESNRNKSAEYGFDGIFPKPSDIEDFKTVIKEIIDLAYVSNETATPSSKTGKILIVDDSELNLLLLGKILKKNGYSFQAFTEGKKAFDFLQTTDETVSYVFTDWIMPGFSGEDLVHSIRSRKRYDEIKIAVLTGLEEDAELSDSAALKNIHVLPKPYSERKIIEYIQNI